MDKDELSRKYNLVSSNTSWQDLRKEFLDVIVKRSKSSVDTEIIRGMLLLIAEADSWEANYIAAVNKQRERDKREE